MGIELWELKQKQSLAVSSKIILSKKRIKEWYEHWKGKVYVSFSGGKDSTVLLHLVREIYPDVPAVFVDTGLEYPEIREFVRTKDNVIWLKPDVGFKKTIEKYGYPVVSKKVARMIQVMQNPTDKNERSRELYMTGIMKNGNIRFKLPERWKCLIDAPFKVSDRCCDEMKKKPIKKYEKETNRKGITGIMADDSQLRTAQYLVYGCNHFDGKPASTPLGFWIENDIWAYIKENCLDYSKIYDMGYDRTGCMFCMFGVHLEPEPNRFQRMKYTHPKLWNYCINKCGVGKVCDYIGINYGNMDLRDFIKEGCN